MATIDALDKKSAVLERKIAAMEARVTQLEDEREIREVLARYGYNADCGRDHAYTNLYTEDGIVNIGAAGANRVWAEGHKQILDFIRDPKGHKTVEGKCMHVMGNNVVCHINGNAAVVNSYNMTLLREGENIFIWTAGNNQWTMKKVNGKWLIKERKRRHIGSGAEFNETLAATPA